MKIYICNNSFINFLWHAVSVNKNAQYLYIYNNFCFGVP